MQNEPISPRGACEQHNVIVVAIVESDFTEKAVSIAKIFGGSCTILHARGKHIGALETGAPAVPDLSRDVILTSVNNEKAAELEEALFEAAGLKTEGHGIVYRLPVNYYAHFNSKKPTSKPSLNNPPGRGLSGGKG